MHNTKMVTQDVFWVGANDRRLAMFEGVYSVPEGVSYNSYLILDDKTVLIDTVDKAVQKRFLENVAHVLDGRALDYLVVQHMEPDHSAAIERILACYPSVKVVCNEKTHAFISQFLGISIEPVIVKENDTLNCGRHTLHFVMAPMVHWPEVMVTYDSYDKILFSADAFGCFGALHGALFADEVDFLHEYMDEARRYYANIVGKYGTQVQALLAKATRLDIEMICPLHGFVWRNNLAAILSKYTLWSAYQPEEKGVLIAYASVYGNTENAAEILAAKLWDKGIRTVMYDVSVTPVSSIVAAAFKWSHLVFASTTYNAGIFVAMEDLLNDLVAHNLQNRTVAVIENGSWAATSGNLIREMMDKCKSIRIIDQTLSILSSLKPEQLAEIDAIADAIAADFPAIAYHTEEADEVGSAVDPSAMLEISYGLFVLTAREGEKDNGCIINAASQITADPLRISVTVKKSNLTHDMISGTGKFNVSVLTASAPFSIFEKFGFSSGRDVDKFLGSTYTDRTTNGVRFVREHTNCVISGKVVAQHDFDTHTGFVAEVVQAFILSDEPSVTYQYYIENIKPKPQLPADNKPAFVCKICAYVYEGETIPSDFICPLCKHGAVDFEPLRTNG